MYSVCSSVSGVSRSIEQLTRSLGLEAEVASRILKCAENDRLAVAVLMYDFHDVDSNVY